MNRHSTSGRNKPVKPSQMHDTRTAQWSHFVWPEPTHVPTTPEITASALELIAPANCPERTPAIATNHGKPIKRTTQQTRLARNRSHAIRHEVGRRKAA